VSTQVQLTNISYHIKSKEPAQKQISSFIGKSSLLRFPFPLVVRFTSEFTKKVEALYKTTKPIIVVPFPHLVSLANILIRMSLPKVCLVTLIVTTTCVLGRSKYSVTLTAPYTNHLLLVTYQQVLGTGQFWTI
jgi:hypothetical protein